MDNQLLQQVDSDFDLVISTNEAYRRWGFNIDINLNRKRSANKNKDVVDQNNNKKSETKQNQQARLPI